jgi:hypothetical protein
MKKVILFLFFMPVPVFCQVTDNFETGNLNRWIESVSGRWKADSTSPLSGKYSLHHVFDNPESGNDQTGIPITSLKPSMGITRWSFKLRHGYDPSSSNNWGVFLISDNGPASMIPGGAVNGFMIGVNLIGYDDTLRLWKIKNGTLTPVLNTGINWQNNIGTTSPAILKVERSQEGKWNTKIFSKSFSILDSASGFDSELFNAEWFGIYYKYSSTRDRLLWIDDISIDGAFYIDKEPPEVIKCINYTYYSADLTLSEEPASEFFQASNFSFNGTSGTATLVIKNSPTSVRVTFKSRFNNKKENEINIRSLCDKAGNCSKDISVKFTPSWAEPGDVIISEIMADPLPSVSLPGKEYIEIFNRTGFSFNLKKWKLSNEGSGSLFPETVINPNEQMILCQLQDTSLFSKFGKVRGMKSFPALTDEGRLLVLYDSLGYMIHGVEYSSEWYNDNLKKEGGWSLEIIDTDFPFFSEGNWTASVSKNGGTPGIANSVKHTNRDIYFKGIENVFPGDSSRIMVYFSEPVFNLKEYIDEIRINGNRIQSGFSTEPLMREFILTTVNPIQKNQQYLLEMPPGVTDFAGNAAENRSFGFGIPLKSIKGDIVFNEILFNPLPGDADYIEFYNTSSKITNVADLLLASVNEYGIYSGTFEVSTVNRSVLPGTYYAITTKKESVITRYFSSVKNNIFQVSSLPSMPDDRGHLILYNRQLEIIDEVTYNEKMHYSLLAGYEGIALEKVRPSFSSGDTENWHSASETSGWGTPGAPNSIYSEEALPDYKIVFSSTRITPDNDGNDDLLVIDLNLKGYGNVISITVFNETGGYVKKLTENLLSGPHASITWDGTADDGSIVNSGIYIFLISLFDENGKSEKWKRVCTVIRRK